MGIIKRKNTKVVRVGDLLIGGDNKIVVQSMTNTDTRDVEATVNQINLLAKAGCELVRVAVMDMEAADAVYEIKKQISIPIVCDIHFDYRIALRVLEYGIDKLRINPGNIGNISRIKEVVDSARIHNTPIRIGVNSGSLEKSLLVKYNKASPQALVESALNHVHILESLDFYDIIVSIKSSSVVDSIESYSLLSEAIDYPIHVGITEAGTFYTGSIKSAVGIGTILSRGIGDTIRVSLTADPVAEVTAAYEILKALNLYREGVEFISCPTCARTRIDIVSIANELEKRCSHIKKRIKIAVMGCAVNGPGEAKDADIGIAGGEGCAVIFKGGKIIMKVDECSIVSCLMKCVEDIVNE